MKKIKKGGSILMRKDKNKRIGVLIMIMKKNTIKFQEDRAMFTIKTLKIFKIIGRAILNIKMMRMTTP